ncbi:c-type cytochrome [Nevskia soli]|uniref:c-type cytochrome n=1 Tax=Nevskia soli TaxID=418856 RepID=UPI000691F53E|nr:c-type cytochrome [Nevskia soli]
MNIHRTLLLAAPLAFCFAPVQAADPAEDLARAKHCYTCHHATDAGVAPSFRQIARRYKGMDNADLVLTREIMDGSADHWMFNKHWGSADMPPSTLREPVNEAESKQLVTWILKQH